MATTHKINLTFLTDVEKNFTITVPHANPAVTATAVNAAMNDVLSADVIVGTQGRPRTKKRAVLIKTDMTEFNFI